MKLCPITFLFGLVVMVASACQDAYVVVTIVDPAGVTDESDHLMVSRDGAEGQRLELSGLPDTLTVTGSDGESARLRVEAMEATTLVAIGHEELTFVSNEIGAARLELAAACDDDSTCDDGLFCNGQEACVDGACAPGDVPCVSDDGCADLVCDEDAAGGEGGCIAQVFHERCGPVVNENGESLNRYCSLTQGCVVGEPCTSNDECDDGENCNGVETCLEGTCVFGLPPERDDGNDCTRDFCDETGIVHLPAPDGNACSVTGGSVDGICVGASCAPSRCGDGFIDVNNGEVCDDGPFNDDAAPSACRETCQPARCGDGVTDLDEACDDQNADNTDGCLDTCELARCGDGLVQQGVEQCDDGNLELNDACLPDCSFNVCGDGIKNDTAESCDDGDNDDFDGCASDCSFIAWTRDLGGPVSSASVVWGSLFDVDNPAQIGVVRGDGEFHALRGEDGSTAWMYDAQSPVVAMPMAILQTIQGEGSFDRIVLLSTDGVVHGLGSAIDDSISDWTIAPAGSASELRYMAANGQRGVIVRDDIGTLNVVLPEGTLGGFFDGYTGPTTQIGACTGCALTSVNHSNPAHGLIATVDDAVKVWSFGLTAPAGTYCDPIALQLQPGERVVEQVVYFGDNSTQAEPDDTAWFVTTNNRLVQAHVENVESCEQMRAVIDWSVPIGARLLSAPVAKPTINTPDREVYVVDDRGDVRAFDVNGALLWTTNVGAPISSTPLWMAETLVVVDDDGVVTNLQTSDGSELWRVELPDGVASSGSPLAIDTAIIVTLVDGRVFALERGVSDSRSLAWRREGANDKGTGHSTACDQQALKDPAFGALLVVVFAIFQRRRMRRRGR